MADFPETRDSLILQVKDPENQEAWEEFAQIYRPVIRRIAIARGLQDADAQDLAQHVLVAVAGAIGRWEKTNPSTRFRHWLRRIARNAIINALTRRPLDQAAGGTSLIDLQREYDQAELDSIKWAQRVAAGEMDMGMDGRAPLTALRQAVTRAFETRIKLQQAQLDAAEAKLNAGRKRLVDRAKRSEQIIERRMAELIGGEETAWPEKRQPASWLASPAGQSSPSSTATNKVATEKIPVEARFGLEFEPGQQTPAVKGAPATQILVYRRRCQEDEISNQSTSQPAVGHHP